MIQLTTFGGPVLLDVEGNPIESILAQPRRLALLIYLALETRAKPLRRDVVMAMFWPEVSQTRASRSLSQAMHFLRTELGHDVFGKPGRDDIQVNRAVVQCDACELLLASEAARYADVVRLYGGDFLRGFYVGDAIEFEQWAEEQRLHLRRLSCESALSAARSAAAEGRAVMAASYARRAAELGLFAEPLVREQMELLDSVGDSAGALEAFETLRRRMRDDLDGEPSLETGAVAERLRSRASFVTPAISSVMLPEQAVPTEHSPRLNAPQRRRQRLIAAAAAVFAFAATLTLWGLTRVPPQDAQGTPVILIDDFEQTGQTRAGSGKALTAAIMKNLESVAELTVKYIAAQPLESAAKPGSDVIVVRGSVSATPWQKPRVVVSLVNGITGDVIAGREFPADQLSDLVSDRGVRAIAEYVRTEVGRYSGAARIADISPKNAEIIHWAAVYRANGDSLRGDGESEQALAAFDAADSLLASMKGGRRAVASALAERAATRFSRAWVFLTPAAIDIASFQRDAMLAVALADSAIELELHYAAAHEVRGFALQMLWQLAPADSIGLLKGFVAMSENAARTAVDLAPARARSWALLAAILYNQGRYAEALNSAQRAYAVNAFLEESAEILYRIFSSAVELGDMGRASTSCKELTRRFPDSGLDQDCRLQLLAWSRPTRAQFDEAARLVAKYKARRIDRDPLVTRLEMELGIIAVRAGLPIDSALAIQNAAIVRASGDPEIAPVRAWFWYAANRPDSASAVLNAYISADPIRRSPLLNSRRFRVQPVIAGN